MLLLHSFNNAEARLHAETLATITLSTAAANGATAEEESGCYGQGAGSVTTCMYQTDFTHVAIVYIHCSGSVAHACCVSRESVGTQGRRKG